MILCTKINSNKNIIENSFFFLNIHCLAELTEIKSSFVKEVCPYRHNTITTKSKCSLCCSFFFFSVDVTP